MPFPTSPSEGQEYSTALGTKYKYDSADDKWYIISLLTDVNAIHKDIANEITGITLKGTPHADDELIIEDSEASYVKKSITLGTLPAPSHALDSHTVPTGSIAMSSQIFTGLGAGSIAGHSVRYEQLHAESHTLTSHSTKTHSELTDYNAETDVKHLTDGQLGDLHSIYSLESHDNTYHSTNYEAEFSKNTAFNKDFGTLGTEVCVGNDSRLHNIYTLEAHNNTYHSTNYHTEAAGTGVATVHSDIISTGSQTIISTAERNAIGDALTIQGITVDDTDIGNTKILKYNSVSGNLEYEDDITGGAGADTDAIHDNIANEITAIIPKTTPVSADEFIIEDSEASFIKKALTFGDLESAISVSTSLQDAFANGKIISGANSLANAVQIGDGTRYFSFWGTANYTQMKMTGGIFYIDNTDVVYIRTNNDNTNYHIFTNTKYYPSNTGLDLGQNSSLTWDVVYHHTLSDKTCADFSQYTRTELYDLFKPIKARTDGILHHDKNSNMYFPHVDMATIPDEFACITEESYDLDNMPIEIEGEIVKEGTIHFDTGSKSGINLNTMVYAMKDLLVKQYEKIEELESRIKDLEGS